MTSPTGTTRPASRPRSAASGPTPAMRQHACFKAKHPECVLFFRMGDFYEMFNDDAVLAHKVLGITLTKRTEGVPMAGVPYHAVEGYLRRMIDAGHRVAVCDQIQDPRDAKGVVDRAVTRVLTPGTLIDEALLDEGTTNHVAAVDLPEGAQRNAAIAVIELSTGSFALVDLPPERITDEIVRLGPSELLYAERADATVPPVIESIRAAVGCALTPRAPWTFRREEARQCLLDHYGVATLGGFGLDDGNPAVGAAGAVLRYLQETQAPDADTRQVNRLSHLVPPKLQACDRYVTVDATTLRNLEIERTIRGRTDADSLLSIFGRCRTGMGKRRLRQWLCFPLRDIDAIEERQESVAALAADRRFSDTLAEHIGSVQDVARIVGRVSMRRATPRDLVALGPSVATLPAVMDLIEGRPAFASKLRELESIADPLRPLAESIAARCVETPPAHLREGGLMRDGVDPELDEARGLQRDATSWLADYQRRLVEETGIPSLKVGYNRVFGYYIEITHAHADKVPAAFSRKQTLKNAERYITPALKRFEEKVTTAQARAVEREKVLFEQLCSEAAAHAPALAAFADIIADLDVLACFARCARDYGLNRPRLVPEPVLDIHQGRHPVLDRTLGERFVPNDCALGRRSDPPAADRLRDEDFDSSPKPQAPSPSSLALITGPNMAGKSTYIRQVALIVLLAHAGSFVPAEAATVGLTDRIFTRIGADDELHAGRSTFMVEMAETANILNHATRASLVILDEIGRGTSTLDGLSLAWAITEALARRGCRTLFATHYHELTGLADRDDAVTNHHVAVREWGDEIIFLYRIEPGRTDRSYGIHVAKIAGVPAETIARATRVLETLTVHTEPLPQLTEQPPAQLDLFKEYVEHPVVETLRAIDLDGMSPLEAFDELRRLQEKAAGKEKGIKGRAP